MTTTTRHNYTALGLILGLAFLGAGCMDTGHQLGDEAVTPIAAPLGALQQAQQLSGEQTALANRQNDSNTNEVHVAMVVLDGNEAPAHVTELGETFGCSDRIGYVGVSRETNSGDTLEDALNTLLSAKDTNVKDLHNSLAYSSLELDKLLSEDASVMQVYLTGEIVTGGVCDTPRIKAQVEDTVRRYRPNFEVYLNGNTHDWRCYGDPSGECI